MKFKNKATRTLSEGKLFFANQMVIKGQNKNIHSSSNQSIDDLKRSFFHSIGNSIVPKCRICMDNHASTENSLF